jgi:hypothetical protein
LEAKTTIFGQGPGKKETDTPSPGNIGGKPEWDSGRVGTLPRFAIFKNLTHGKTNQNQMP